MKRVVRRVLMVGGVAALTATSSFALFPVIDPGAILQLAKSLIQMKQQYTVAMNTFTQAKYNMTHFTSNLKQRWSSIQSQIMQSNSQNRFGENANFGQAINMGQNTGAAWNGTGPQLRPANGYSNLPTDSPILSAMAAVERYQGYGPNALSIIGQTRMNGVQNQQALKQLQATVSSNPNDTEGEQLNTLNASNLLVANSLQQQNILLASMAESQAIRAKLEQDQLTQQFNTVAHAETMRQTTPTEVSIDDISVNGWTLK